MMAETGQSVVVDTRTCQGRPSAALLPPPARAEFAGRANEIEVRIGGSGSRALVIVSGIGQPGPRAERRGQARPPGPGQPDHVQEAG
jgi:hypothetical protein